MNGMKWKTRPYPTGASHPRWRGGYINKAGYREVWVNNKRQYEHRLVMGRLLGRPLQRWEVVHHLNGKKADNRPENLAVIQNGTHSSNHLSKRADLGPRGEDSPLIACACGCGSILTQFDSRRRPRRFMHGHNGRLATAHLG